jgi:thioredoxin-related protein
MNCRNAIFALLLCLAASTAQAYSFLYGYEEAPTIAQAVERVKGQPDKHVLIYFGLPKNCPQCNYTRTMLSGGPLSALWKPNYIVVNVDLYHPSGEERQIIEKYRVSWAPVLAFLDGSGRRVAYAKQLRNEKEALLLNEYVSKKLYARTDFNKYYAANFEAKGAERVVPETKVAATPARIDDRPRFRDVLAQKHERLTGDELNSVLAGKRMHKENQDWFLVLDLKPRNALDATGRRKDGKGAMQGPGKWYVTKKGKFCLEISSGGVDENWCRHVFRAGEGYYVVKDLRPERLAYRFALEAL